MIQRKQTLFLLLAAVCLGIAALWATNNVVMVILLLVAALASVATVFLYKKRKRQAMCIVPIIGLLVVWYVLLAVYYSWQQLSWADAMPMVAVLMLFMARQGIISDEKLVRSLDRIR